MDAFKKKLKLYKNLPRRWWLFKLIDGLIALYPTFYKKRQGIALLQLYGIGDALLFRPYIEKYAEAFGVPLEEITVLAGSGWKALIPIMYQGITIKIIDTRAVQKRPFYRLKVGLWLKMQRFKAITCNMYFRRALVADSLMVLSGAPLKYVASPKFTKRNQAEFDYYLPKMTEVIDTGAFPTHESIRHANFLSKIAGYPIGPQPPSLKAGVKLPKTVALNFGASEKNRCWPFDNFLEIARFFLKEGWTVYFVGGPDEVTRKAQISTFFKDNSKVINLVGEQTLSALAELLGKVEFVLSNETGPGHMAAAARSKTLMLCGGGHFDSFVPFPKELQMPNAHFLYEKMPCYYCNWNCTKLQAGDKAFPCIQILSIEEVWQKIKEILSL